MKYRLVLLSLGLLVACGGNAVEEHNDGEVIYHGVIEEPAAEPVSPSYSEIAPVMYLPFEPCGLRLRDELDGARTTIVGSPGGRMALAVCARVSDSDEWVVVDGLFDVENISGGRARVLPIPPDNASALADAPASLQAVTVGHVRLTAKFGDMTGSGVIEIVAE